MDGGPWGLRSCTWSQSPEWLPPSPANPGSSILAVSPGEPGACLESAPGFLPSFCKRTGADSPCDSRTGPNCGGRTPGLSAGLLDHLGLPWTSGSELENRCAAQAVPGVRIPPSPYGLPQETAKWLPPRSGGIPNPRGRGRVRRRATAHGSAILLKLRLAQVRTGVAARICAAYSTR
jgi:hypothetical protein